MPSRFPRARGRREYCEYDCLRCHLSEDPLSINLYSLQISCLPYSFSFQCIRNTYKSILSWAILDGSICYLHTLLLLSEKDASIRVCDIDFKSKLVHTYTRSVCNEFHMSFPPLRYIDGEDRYAANLHSFRIGIPYWIFAGHNVNLQYIPTKKKKKSNESPLTRATSFPLKNIR